jgi:pyrroloquinoline quinone biosynthesis protein D
VSERPQVHDGAVPALTRGVKLRFDKARDAWVLLAPEKVLMPDQIAIEILKRCDGKAPVTAIVDDLAATFSADRAQVAADVHAFLQDLADKGLLRL